MDVTINIAYGDDLSIGVDMNDTTMHDATQMLGTVCNELMRTNMALTMQGESG